MDTYLYRMAFPSSLANKVDAVCRHIVSVYEPHIGPSAIVDTEKIRFPARTYFNPRRPMGKADRIADLVSLCLYTRHCNGYVRESSLVELLTGGKIEYFTLPFILKLAEEYVLEITNIVLARIRDLPVEDLRRFLAENPGWLDLMDARCVSYWNLSYRPKWWVDKEIREMPGRMFANYRDYPGAQIVSYLREVQAG